MTTTVNADLLKFCEATDLPSDPNGYMGDVRSALRRAYNSNRVNSDVMIRLHATLTYINNLIEAGMDIPVREAEPVIFALTPEDIGLPVSPSKPSTPQLRLPDLSAEKSTPAKGRVVKTRKTRSDKGKKKGYPQHVV